MQYNLFVVVRHLKNSCQHAEEWIMIICMIKELVFLFYIIIEI